MARNNDLVMWAVAGILLFAVFSGGGDDEPIDCSNQDCISIVKEESDEEVYAAYPDEETDNWYPYLLMAIGILLMVGLLFFYWLGFNPISKAWQGYVSLFKWADKNGKDNKGRPPKVRQIQKRKL